MSGAIRGVRVLDLSRVLAGPLCAQMLADHGAQVIKVEAPAGDETRRWGPPFADEAETTSAYYQGLNRNKSNIVLDLRTQPAREVLYDLIARADVVVENFKAGTMQGWGLGYESRLARDFPRLVYCRITGYGVDGPLGGLPGYDAALQAYGGLMSLNGERDGEPLRVGVPIVDITAAHQAFAGVLLALLERAGSGRGQLVDVTLFDAVLSILHPHAATYLQSGEVPERTGAAHPTVAPYQVFRTAGPGRLFVAAASDAQFAALTGVLGRPHLADDPRFRRNRDRVGHRVELLAELEPVFLAHDAGDLAVRLAARGVPASPVHDIDAALSAPHTLHRAMVVRDGAYRGVGVPIKLSRSAPVPPRAPAAAGADTYRVLAELGCSAERIAALGRSGAFGAAGAVTDRDG
ncbi:crotonobetainyl-CoA:carnitine CoA-transferase CaiB-like acyl-CoA transferase [Streptosporangium becharense]|uniref:Crotonobetainyl-CoA:carnitine CoA-transferase CaiB-like acyl-CoA transferase n=1 Tax=Streptosporangium becharense TaxID=1816182 RepID=A0A7W9IP35_9ACTN|nr:CoA transferase [Streptosporangium becharense]MBB2914369.1 crotonobetainyl-CoA:carnitine CoA-transferase CaiB-like acyl-CoA transferase [Streptosporangium becharense]MBB5823599.1 crotonobetainyl-CoA:carnitine CoA-transferase CaiB-like acyl-CoA transferase [Streptosporangium becharense]